MTQLGRVTIAGIGPGASESLLTVEVSELLGEADLVIYAGTMMAPSLRARVRHELLFGADLTDVVIRERVLAAVALGKHVAWLEPGDPSLYSGEPGRFGSLSENTAWLRTHDIAYEVMPGISSLHALTARLGLEHAGPALATPLVLYAPGRENPARATERLQSLCAQKLPLALFLAIERLPLIVHLATQHYGEASRIVIGYKIGWPEERILDSTLGNILGITDGSDLPRHCIILLGPWHG